MKSLFIVLDGVDGSGKSLMIRKAAEFFKSKKYDVLLTAEPTDGVYGKKARELLKKDKDPKKNASLCLELFTKDRKQHLDNEILPFIQRDDSVVLCDRYYYSTIAYQHTQGLAWEEVLSHNKDFLKPDVAIILDLDINLALERMDIRGGNREKFEKKEFMEKLRANFLELKNKLDDNLVYIDASKKVDLVFDDVLTVIKKLTDDLNK